MTNKETKQEVDTILLGGTAITVDSERRVIRDAGIAVQGEDILFVGKAAEASERYQAKQTMDCKDKVIIPGIVNAHIHYQHQLSKGLIPDNLGPVLQSNFTHSHVSPHLTVEDEIWGTKAFLLEMLKGGTTTFLEVGSYHPLENIQSDIQSIGIKGMMGKRAFDRVDTGSGSQKLKESADNILSFYEMFLSEFGKENLPIRPTVAIAGMARFTDRLAIECKKIADKYGVLFNLHISCYDDTVHEIRQRTGCRPVEHLEKLGVLDKNVVLVHMLYVNQKEVNILAKRGTKVVWCPSAALRTAYALQFGRYPEMLEAGIPVALGSDGADCSNYHDMIRVMNLASVLYKGIRCDPQIMGAETAIEMATINGAQAMGLENEIGSLEAGKKADIVIFDTNRLEWRPMFNEIQNLIHSANGESVETVIINGNTVVDGGKVLTIDEEEIMVHLREREKDLKTRLEIGTISPWKFI